MNVCLYYGPMEFINSSYLLGTIIKRLQDVTRLCERLCKLSWLFVQSTLSNVLQVLVDFLITGILIKLVL